MAHCHVCTNPPLISIITQGNVPILPYEEAYGQRLLEYVQNKVYSFYIFLTVIVKRWPNMNSLQQIGHPLKLTRAIMLAP